MLRVNKTKGGSRPIAPAKNQNQLCLGISRHGLGGNIFVARVYKGNVESGAAGYDNSLMRALDADSSLAKLASIGLTRTTDGGTYCRIDMASNQINKQKTKKGEFNQNGISFNFGSIDGFKAPETQAGHNAFIKELHALLIGCVKGWEKWAVNDHKVNRADWAGKNAPFENNWAPFTEEVDLTRKQACTFVTPFEFPPLDEVLVDKSTRNVIFGMFGNLEESEKADPQNSCIYDFSPIVPSLYHRRADMKNSFPHIAVTDCGFPPSAGNDDQTITDRLIEIKKVVPKLQSDESNVTDSEGNPLQDEHGNYFRDIPALFVVNVDRFLEQAKDRFSEKQVEHMQAIGDLMANNEAVTVDSREDWEVLKPKIQSLVSKKRDKQSTLEESGFSVGPAGSKKQKTDGGQNLSRHVTNNGNQGGGTDDTEHDDEDETVVESGDE